MKKLSTTECKEYIFLILKKFAKFCDEYKLSYYLAGGTLLGAIRHKDFIPWDDDIDVFMPKPDYLRLQEILKDKVFYGHYQLISDLNKKTKLPFSKIIDLNTKVETKFNSIDTRLWIDIFPLDGLPESQNEALKVLKKANEIKTKYGYASAKVGTGTSRSKKILKIPYVLFCHLIGTDYYIKKLKAMSEKYSYEKSKYIANIVWSTGKGELLNKEEYLPVCDVEFHGEYFHTTKSWDKYLKNVYGNYMELPPESKRYAHCIEAYLLEKR